jgi:hypothetical protein
MLSADGVRSENLFSSHSHATIIHQGNQRKHARKVQHADFWQLFCAGVPEANDDEESDAPATAPKPRRALRPSLAMLSNSDLNSVLGASAVGPQEAATSLTDEFAMD